MNPNNNSLHPGCRSLHGFYQQDIEAVNDVAVSSNADNSYGTTQTGGVNNHSQHMNNRDSNQFPLNQLSQVNHGHTAYQPHQGDVNGVGATGQHALAYAASDQYHSETIEENPNYECARGLMLLTAATQPHLMNAQVNDGNVSNDAGVLVTEHSGSRSANEEKLQKQSSEPDENNSSAASVKNEATDDEASMLEQQCGTNHIKDGKVRSIVADTNVSQAEPIVETEAIDVVVDVAAENIDANELEDANNTNVGPAVGSEEAPKPGAKSDTKNDKTESDQTDNINDIKAEQGDARVDSESCRQSETKEDADPECTDQRPPSTKLASKGVICLQGTLSRYTDGRIKIAGVWAMELDVILSDPQNTAAFEYEHEQLSRLQTHSVALQGKYNGWFEVFSVSENRKVRCQETDVDLKFIENRDGSECVLIIIVVTPGVSFVKP